MDPKKNQMIVSALCIHFSLEPEPFLVDVGENDIKTLYSNVQKSSGKEITSQKEEVSKWLEFVEGLPLDSIACFPALQQLNGELATKSVLSANGLTPSGADVAVFSALHSSVLGLSDSDKKKVPHVMRWMNYIQNTERLSKLFGAVPVEEPKFDFEVPKSAPEPEADSNAKNVAQGSKTIDKSETQQSTKKNDPGKLRDLVSEGLVLCASNEDDTVVEPLLPPEGAKPGERVSFSGIEGKPEEALNPKKKQLEKITPVCASPHSFFSPFPFVSEPIQRLTP